MFLPSVRYLATKACSFNVDFHWDFIGYRKKRHNTQLGTDREMFKLADVSGSHNDITRRRTLGFRNRLVQRFTRKETRFDDTENILGASKGKSRKKTRKEPVWFHDNIYDMDEVDSKFEGGYEVLN